MQGGVRIHPIFPYFSVAVGELSGPMAAVFDGTDRERSLLLSLRIFAFINLACVPARYWIGRGSGGNTGNKGSAGLGAFAAKAGGRFAPHSARLRRVLPKMESVKRALGLRGCLHTWRNETGRMEISALRGKRANAGSALRVRQLLSAWFCIRVQDQLVSRALVHNAQQRFPCQVAAQIRGN